MSKRSKLQILVAAVAVLVGGALMGLAGDHEETINLEVLSDGGEEMTIMINGEKEVLSVNDLEEGEVRTIDDGEHGVITVERRDGSLHVNLDKMSDGEHHGIRKHVIIHGDEEGAHRMMLKGEPHGVHVRKLIADEDCELHGEDHEVFIIKKGEGEAGVWNFSGHEDGDPIVIDIDEEHSFAFHTGAEEGLHRHLSERVALSCPEDGTRLSMAKDKATQERYLCPVCGDEMEKTEEMVHKFITVVKEEQEEVE
ncbi:MAG: hypothetical protein GY906_00265 [bacterium]|nr:hypothetical protein [bacterium]